MPILIGYDACPNLLTRMKYDLEQKIFKIYSDFPHEEDVNNT